MTLRIQQAGVMASIQDWGRYAYQSQGFAPAGPMDEHAFLWANKLLENNYNAAQIEISMGMFTAEFTQATTVALCGANTNATLNGKQIGNWRSFSVEAGDVLRCQYAPQGVRAYLAVAGGFQVEAQLGSSACTPRQGIGGLNGSALSSGDEIHYQADKCRNVLVPDRFIPRYEKQLRIGYYPVYQHKSFSDEMREQLQRKLYQVTGDSDRMGIRLQGPIIQAPETLPLSEGIAFGSIQIPADGQPIILAKDRQCIGGYPKIACVNVLDMSVLAQAQPGTQIRFYQCDLYEQLVQLRKRNAFFNIN